ncbi:MAG: DNA translocase FtsK 4TM domain-containing protein [Litorivicinaceae bacterium]
MNESKPQTWYSRLIREVTWLLGVALTVFLLLALLSFDVKDPGWSYQGAVTEVHNAIGLVGAPLEVLLMAAVAYGLLILLIDRVLLPRLDTAAAQEKIVEDIKRAEAGEGGEEDVASTLAQARAEAAEREARRSPFRDLFDRGATILVVFTSLDLLGLVQLPVRRMSGRIVDPHVLVLAHMV